MNIDRMTAGDLLEAFEPPLSPDVLLHMEVNLHVQEEGGGTTLYVALRVGLDRMYVVRSLPSFLRAFERGEPQRFGKGFVLDPGSMRFERIDMRVLSLLSEVEAAQRPCEAQGYKPPQSGKFMPLGEQASLRLLRLLMARPFRFITGKDIVEAEPIARAPLPIACELSEAGGGLSLWVRCAGLLKPIAPSYEFVCYRDVFLQLPPVQRGVARVILSRLTDGEARFLFG